ncbi:MarR family winged helix-turn-helix transcriptional regulator [Microcystis aeruginosa]|uniref:MarR family winged helix-turn-helix transcriptional regulator n=1 Tax=Microcystis aeruginosa TaxID=1126 RepID=UPI00232BBA58|nr:MarR family transcriptional regulator [Microcystis aeruginosa]MDB9412377.1 MarR family transcriptional regulator [Microcystis aeruginosa CS-567/02]
MKLIASTADAAFPTALDALTFQFEDLPRQLRRIFDEAIQSAELGRTQWRLLAYVLRHEGMTQTELARLLEIERASAGLAIDSLEKKALVSREQHPTDRRVWQIVPTDKARTLLGELREVVDEIYAKVFEGFSDSELRQLGSFFNRISRNLKD